MILSYLLRKFLNWKSRYNLTHTLFWASRLRPHWSLRYCIALMWPCLAAQNNACSPCYIHIVITDKLFIYNSIRIYTILQTTLCV